MSKPRGCVETIRVEVILCYPSSQQNLQKLESFISKSLAATQIKKIQKNFKENPCKYLQNIKLFIVKVVSKYNAQKLQRAMKRNQKLLDTYLTVSSSITIDTVAKKNAFGEVIPLKKLSLGESKCLFCWILDKQPNLCAAGTLQVKSDKAIIAIYSTCSNFSWRCNCQ